MSNQLSYMTKCIESVELLRKDVADGQLAFYQVDKLPPGLLPQSLADKCTSAVVAVSGNGTSSYVAIIPERLDVVNNVKVHDNDPIIYAANTVAGETFPTGAFIHHSNYPGRTAPVSGYETCSYQQTINAIKADLITGLQPLSSSDPKYIAAISHGIYQFNQYLGNAFEEWSVKKATTERPDF